jgi:hypothetical protein
MDGDIVGLAAVIMIFGIPIAGMYTYYCVRKLRADERLAAIARGASIPMQQDLTPAAMSRRSGILLVAGSLGYMLTFALISRVEPDAWIAGTFGIIPFAVGLGFFLDAFLVRRDLKSSAS